MNFFLLYLYLSRSTTPSSFLTPLHHHLLPHHILHHPQAARLSLHRLLNLAHISLQLSHLPIVEFLCIACALLDVEAGADIDEDSGVRL